MPAAPSPRRRGPSLAGFDARVTKPVEPAEWVSLVARLARRPGAT
jgi:hypothetical protein